MAIHLRVVGIFYRTAVELEGGCGTVKDVLVAAQEQIAGGTSFSFFPVTGPNGIESPRTFRAFYESSFVSPASGMTYSEGEYILSEQLEGNPYTVWQYYIFDANGRFINRDKGFIAYDDKKLALVEDGQSVTWRLVTILNGPTGMNPRIAGQIKSRTNG